MTINQIISPQIRPGADNPPHDWPNTQQTDTDGCIIEDKNGMRIHVPFTCPFRPRDCMASLHEGVSHGSQRTGLHSATLLV